MSKFVFWLPMDVSSLANADGTRPDVDVRVQHVKLIVEERSPKAAAEFLQQRLQQLLYEGTLSAKTGEPYNPAWETEP